MVNLTRFDKDSEDIDMPMSQVRSLLKAVDGSPTRKRVVGNIFQVSKGRSQPREGFLSLEVMRAVYTRSEVVRACIDMLIEFVVSADWEIKPVDSDHSQWLKKRKPDQYQDQRKRINWLKQFFSHPSSYQGLEQFHRKILKDLLIYDAAAYEIVSASYGGSMLPLELGAIPGDTVEIETDDAGIPTKYWQTRNVLHNVEYEQSEIAYMMLNPCTWQPYGMSPIETFFVSITSDLNANKYNADYFAKNAIPPALLAVLGVNESQFRQVMSQMRNTSSDNPWNIHAFRAQRNPDGSAQNVFELVPLSQVTNKEMQFAELVDHVSRRICMAFKVTPSQIGLTGEMSGGIGNGIAEEQSNLTQNKGVSPLLRSLERAHTENIIHEICGWSDLKFAFASSTTPEEEKEYQQSVQEVQMGVKTINEHRQQFGAREPVEWGDLPLVAPQGWQPPMTPQQLQQQAMQMGMGAPPGMPGQPPGQGGPPQMQPPQPPDPGDMQKSIIIHL